MADLTDRELLERVGRLALHEHAAWVARNKARKALRTWLHSHRAATGEWFDRDVAESEDVAALDALRQTATAAQKRLTTARATTRRAAAAIGAGQPAQGGGA